MSRSGYSDDLDQWALIKWRGQVASAIRGKRGQAFLRELATALDAMPVKRLIANDFADATGEVCTLGALTTARQLDVAEIDPEDSDHHKTLAGMLNVAPQLVQEVEFMNDEFMNDDWFSETPEARWTRMRNWVESQIGRPAFPDPREG